MTDTTPGVTAMNPAQVALARTDLAPAAEELVSRLVEMLTPQAIWLWGSAVAGDFIIGSSDLDLLVVTAAEPETVTGQPVVT